jgi:hypothetical protein
MTQTYIGIKTVQAEPEVREGTDGYKVIYEEGYTSWCPKDVFEKHNRLLRVGNTAFGVALEAARQGKRLPAWGGMTRDCGLNCRPQTSIAK